MEFSQLFTDKMGKTIYYYRKTKQFYLVKEKQQRQVTAFHNRLFISLASAVLVPGILQIAVNRFLPNPPTIPWWIGVPIFGAFILFFDWFLDSKIVPSLQPLKKYDSSNRIVKPKQSPKFMMIKTVLYAVIGILLLASLFYNNEADTMSNLVVVLFGFIALGLAFTSYIELSNERKRL